MAGEYEQLVQAVHADPDPEHRADAMRVIAAAAAYISGDTAAADAMCAPVLTRLYSGEADPLMQRARALMDEAVALMRQHLAGTAT